MDTIIPILLALGFFLLQGYLGYKKEQEKAAKRNLGKPPRPHATQAEQQQPAKRDWLEELLQPEQPSPSKDTFREVPQPVGEVVKPYEEAYTQTYVEPKYESTYKREKYVPTEVPVSLLAEYKRLSTYDESGELKRAKKIRNEKRSEIKRVEIEALEARELEYEKLSINFDLNEAVIMKAILDRPYQ